MQKALVSVTGLDKPGIIAGVSTELYQMEINILDITQTILGGYFTMLMIVDMEAADLSLADISARLTALGEKQGVSIQVQRTDIFDAMHRV